MLTRYLAAKLKDAPQTRCGALRPNIASEEGIQWRPHDLE